MNNTLLYISIILAIFLLLRNDLRTYEEVPGSKHFYLSNGRSKQVYDLMKKDGISEDRLKNFVMMEDYFLSLEKYSVCHRTSRTLEASGVSQTIQDTFIGYDFTYHQDHIKQMSQPTKNINKKIVCLY